MKGKKSHHPHVGQMMTMNSELEKVIKNVLVVLYYYNFIYIHQMCEYTMDVFNNSETDLSK